VEKSIAGEKVSPFNSRVCLRCTISCLVDSLSTLSEILAEEDENGSIILIFVLHKIKFPIPEEFPLSFPTCFPSGVLMHACFAWGVCGSTA